jgi:membrane protease YdiL (CAAX protease family)
VIHVRTQGGSTRACEPAELASEDGPVRIGADTPVAREAAGPFDKAAVAIEEDGRLRDLLAAAIPTPSLAAWRRVRWPVVAAAAIPLLMLLELDRELAAARTGSPAQLVVDAAVAAYVAWELTRSTPRLPGVAAAAMAAVAVRFGLFASRLCGRAHVLVWAALVLAACAAGAIAARAPSRGRSTLEVLAKLGVSRSDAFAARRGADASTKLVGATILAAVALPLGLAAMRRSGAGLDAQSLTSVAYAVIVPVVVRRTCDPERALSAGAAAVLRPGRVLLAVAAGFALTAALADGARHFFAAGAELARCTGHLDAEARRALAEEAEELARGLARVRGTGGALAMAVAVAPLVEERIYRDLLMNALVRKYGLPYGLFASAVVFGVAHAGVYQVALYQTVMLGLAFGVAYAEGGLLAAFTVHAAWNLARLAQ